MDWSTPHSITTLRGFLGLIEFYRHFVRHYVRLTSPFTDLLHDSNFIWNQESELAFTTLKKTMATTPVLELSQFALPFHEETDAFATAIGAILSQQGHPIAYFSKMLCHKVRVAFEYAREMLAITDAIKNGVIT